jgi:hypothetical protein
LPTRNVSAVAEEGAAMIAAMTASAAKTARRALRIMFSGHRRACRIVAFLPWTGFDLSRCRKQFVV